MHVTHLHEYTMRVHEENKEIYAQLYIMIMYNNNNIHFNGVKNKVSHFGDTPRVLHYAHYYSAHAARVNTSDSSVSLSLSLSCSLEFSRCYESNTAYGMDHG